MFSLERVWRCDCYRAGDGVHGAWLERRARVEPAWRVRLRAWNPKHRQILALEESLFGRGGARTVIANSRLVRDEILDRYGGRPGRVQVVYNGLPAACFLTADPARAQTHPRRMGFEGQRLRDPVCRHGLGYAKGLRVR